VISPYKSQVKLIQQILEEVLPTYARHVDVNTIDGFQGREKEVVVFSAVRSTRTKSGNIGFVADERRINVGLSRARCSLLLVGNRHTLMKQHRWEALIRATAEAGCAAACKRLLILYTNLPCQCQCGTLSSTREPESSLLLVGNRHTLMRQHRWEVLVRAKAEAGCAAACKRLLILLHDFP
jgi:senataxin